jgi:hypothetical protein
VLGLKAFVLASPYDVPAWLPGVLLVLTRAASQPPPIKTTVRRAAGRSFALRLLEILSANLGD